MSLPKIDEIFTIVHLPVADIDAKIYAFTVKEERTLIVANMSGDADSEAAIIDLLKSKTDGVNIDELTLTDIIFLFVSILGISKGTTQEYLYKCTNIVDGVECGNSIKVPVSLSNFTVTGNGKNHTLIKINDNLALELVYPSYTVYKELKQYSSKASEYIFHLFAKCISVVYYNDDVTTEFSDDEIYNWIMTLPSVAIEKFNEFITNMPVLSVKYELKCDKCGHTEDIEIKNILSFFTQPSQEKI